MAEKISSPACERNKDVILALIKPLLVDITEVLEIGSGTGQHAVYFAQALPQLHWQCSDKYEYHDIINAWIEDSGLINVGKPLVLDVSESWPLNAAVPAIFTANSLHIMSWACVEALFFNLADYLQKNGLFMVYGPFNYDGQYTSASNAEFDLRLKQRDARSGIRDFEAIDALARQQSLALVADYTMPANNRLLVWKKSV